MRFDLRHFESLIRQLTRAINTPAVGILIAGVVASALVPCAEATSLAYAAFAVALVLMLWLVWNMSRSS